MRILHIIASLDPSGGGPPAVAVRLASAQASLGNDVGVASYRNYGPNESEERTRDSMARVPSIERLAMHRLDPPSRMERLLAPAARKTLATLVPASDVLHLHGVWEPFLAWAASIARQAGIPYIVRPAGMLDVWSLQQSRLKKQIALTIAYRRMLNGAAFIHALNEEEAAAIKPLRLRAPVRIIPNGVFLEELQPLPVRGTFRSRFPAIGDRPFILFLSRLHYKKGLDYLADSFKVVAASTPDVHLVVAGPDDGYRATFEQLIRERGIAERVHIVGGLYGSDKIAALVDATCFCLPSRQEGFSVAITEALACGVPVIISDQCHFPEVGHAGAGEIVPLESAAVAQSLLRVLSDEALRNQMSEAGRRLVHESFTWPIVARRCIEAYTGRDAAPLAHAR